jgi:hypothetical protein
MGGGLMQLVAYGAQDIYLTGNPQITFFKVVYRRHTNFSMECIKQTFTGTPDFGSSATATISRNGDLVSGLYVTFDPQLVTGKASTQGTDGLETTAERIHTSANVGFGLIKQVDIEIGGQRIDRQFGKWMNVWSDLTDNNPSRSKGHINTFNGEYGTCSNTDPRLQSIGVNPIQHRISGISGGDHTGDGLATQSQMTSFNVAGTLTNDLRRAVAIRQASVPLQFWFCRNPGLALPLIALQYHEVKIKLDFVASSSFLSVSGSSSLTDFEVAPALDKVELWADYIYLDTDERRRFAQVSHEYLIEQVQHDNFPSGKNFSLNFNHPVKELIWCGEPLDAAVSTSARIVSGPSVPQRLTISGTHQHQMPPGAADWTIKLNGHERFAPREPGYFTGTQVDNHHSGTSGIMIPESIYVYSFALKPEEHQPSGTCNFSRIDNAELKCAGTVVNNEASKGIDIYAVNYNVLRIMSGMGGLAYSN